MWLIWSQLDCHIAGDQKLQIRINILQEKDGIFSLKEIVKYQISMTAKQDMKCNKLTIFM